MDGAAVYGFLVVFVVIGGLELFDRTSFALIALASRAPALESWAGGTVAFVVTTALAVGLGEGLSAVFGPGRIGLLRVAGGVFLLGYALWLFFHHEEEASADVTTSRTAFLGAFLTIALLELGDTTMIFEVVFVANFGWLIVLVAGVLGLSAVAAWDVWLGRRLGTRVSPERLKRVVVAVLAIVGAFSIVYGLAPGLFPSLSVATGL